MKINKETKIVLSKEKVVEIIQEWCMSKGLEVESIEIKTQIKRYYPNINSAPIENAIFNGIDIKCKEK